MSPGLLPDLRAHKGNFKLCIIIWLVLGAATCSKGNESPANSIAQTDCPACPTCPACQCQCECKFSLEQACKPSSDTEAPSETEDSVTSLKTLAEVALPSPSPEAPPTDWQLLWGDDFDSFNECNFEVQVGTGCQMNLCGWGNGQAQYYTGKEDNLFTEGGVLNLQAQRETWEEWFPYARYTSGRLRTYKKHAFVPGDKWPKLKIEARMKVPQGQGLVTSFWMLPDESPPTCQGCGRYPGGWSTNGQINIATITGGATQVTGTLFYGGAYPDSASFSGSGGLPGGDSLADGFHNFTLEWDLTEMRWLLDGTQFHQAESGQGALKGWWTDAVNKSTINAPFDQPFYIIINLALKGEKPFPQEDPILETSLAEPQQLQIDYLRVYGYPSSSSASSSGGRGDVKSSSSSAAGSSPGNGSSSGSPPVYGSVSAASAGPSPSSSSEGGGVGYGGGHIIGPSCCTTQVDL